MSDNDDKALIVRAGELPVSRRRRSRNAADLEVPNTSPKSPARRELTEGQVDKLFDAGAETMRGLVGIGETVVDIVRIREQADADVSRIEAETRRVVQQIQAAVELRKEERKTLRERGSVVVDVIDAITRQIATVPVDDPASRRKAIEILPELVRAAASEGE